MIFSKITPFILILFFILAVGTISFFIVTVIYDFLQHFFQFDIYLEISSDSVKSRTITKTVKTGDIISFPITSEEKVVGKTTWEIVNVNKTGITIIPKEEIFMITLTGNPLEIEYGKIQRISGNNLVLEIKAEKGETPGNAIITITEFINMKQKN